MAMSSFVAAITLVFLVFILKVPARARLKPAEVELFCFQIYNICNCYVMSPFFPHHMI